MSPVALPFGTTDWSTIEPVAHADETGTAWWRTCQFGVTRVRMLEYNPGYMADHGCWRGHILLCLEEAWFTAPQEPRFWLTDFLRA